MATKLSGREDLFVYESRFRYLYIAVLVFFVLVLFRLWFLQLYKGTELYLYAEKNRMWEEKELAPRGMIFDRNGELLVDNKLSFDIVIRPQFLKDQKETITKIAGLLNIPEEDIRLRLLRSKKLPMYYPIPIALDVDRDKVALVEANKLFIPGIDVLVTNKRTYLFGEAAAHLIGYIGEVNKPEMNKLARGYESHGRHLEMGDYIGKFGLEKVWDLDLRGVDGAKYMVVDANGRMRGQEEIEEIFGEIPTTESEPGNNLQLTIDADLQNIAYKYFADNNRKGAVVAIDARNGDVLVMFSYPGFDPTVMSKGVTPEILKEIKSNPFRPFYNKNIQDHYSPGSAFKPLVALAALEEGMATPETITQCLGRLWFGNRYFHCHKKEGHGNIDLHDGIVKSCDVVFYKLGIKLGVDRVYKYATMLGLGQRTGIDLPEENRGLMPSTWWKLKRVGYKWMPGEDLSMAIGQGYDLVTPLQLVNMYAGMASGNVYRPHVVKHVKDVDGNILWTSRPEVLHKVNLKPSTKDFMMKALWGVVNEQGGTAWWYRLPELDMAGKTGTVQLYGISAGDIYKKCENLPELKRHHGWFVGFAPYDKPEIAVAVVAEHSCHGSSGAAPLVRDLVKAYHDKYGFERERGKN